MTSTRHASPGGPLRQERFASSYEQGLLANQVAKRCALLASPADRALVWFCQWLSWQPGGLSGAAADIHAALKWKHGSPSDAADYITDLVLNPEFTLGKPAHNHLTDGEPGLVDYRASWILRQPKHVETAVSRRVESALDYARSARCLALIDGPARIGKTFAARHWCAASAGLARYVQVPCSNDDRALFTAIAGALGLSCSRNYKANEIRDRVEETLAGGDLLLVLDEAHYLWPQYGRSSSPPERVNWVMAALVNQGVPVALVTTPQFYTAQKQVERNTGWTSEQFIGRIGHVERLPQRLEKADLLAVAKALLPECGNAAWSGLAAYAELSKKHLASIEAIAKRARWLAQQDGRTEPTAGDVRLAMKESVIPSDNALAESLAAASQPRRRSAAVALPDRCNGLADPAPGRRFNPEILTSEDASAPCLVSA
jgi:hypothetical protein